MVSDDLESFADLDGHTFRQAYTIGTTGGWNVIDLMGAGPGLDESGLTESEFSLLQAAAAAEQAAQQQPASPDPNQQPQGQK